LAPGSSGESVTGAISDQPQHGLDVPFDVESAGIIVLTATGAIAASNPRALELFACGSAEELRALCQPILKRLSSGLPHAHVTTAQQFELQIVARPQPRRILVSAHHLGSGPMHWLLLTRAEDSARRLDGILEHAARNQLLQRLYGTLRHDLHSPIQAVLWTLDLLQRAAQQAPVSPEQRAQLDESATLGRKELDRLKASVRRFLSFAMPTADRERLDVGAVAQDVQRVIAAEASLFDVRISVQPPSQPLMIEAVRGQLEQAFAALMLNAMDAIPAGGEVTTSVREHEGQAEIIVTSSSAAGASPSRSHHASTDAPPRFAVGLHAARAVATSHGGDISEPAGNGARTFRMRLPLARTRAGSV
jgi:signal transduction histidine kinase